jgi:hypothetical protein
MSPHDQENLLFLLGMDAHGLNQWFEQASENDRCYAESLLARAQTILVEAALDKLYEQCIEDELKSMEEFPEAQKVLDKFMY